MGTGEPEPLPDDAGSAGLALRGARVGRSRRGPVMELEITKKVPAALEREEVR
jgi:hypothetical protein